MFNFSRNKMCLLSPVSLSVAAKTKKSSKNQSLTPSNRKNGKSDKIQRGGERSWLKKGALNLGRVRAGMFWRRRGPFQPCGLHYATELGSYLALAWPVWFYATGRKKHFFSFRFCETCFFVRSWCSRGFKSQFLFFLQRLWYQGNMAASLSAAQ